MRTDGIQVSYRRTSRSICSAVSSPYVAQPAGTPPSVSGSSVAVFGRRGEKVADPSTLASHYVLRVDYLLTRWSRSTI